VEALHTAKHLPHNFPLQNGPDKEILYYSCFSTWLQDMSLGRSRKLDRTEIIWDTTAFVYADDVNVLQNNINTIVKNAEILIVAI
jgi:hypothetical protein